MKYFNNEGYASPTEYEAINRIQREETKKKYHPLVYICSPFSHGDVKENVRNVRHYCRYAVEHHAIPFAPHLLFPQFMNDSNPAERSLAMLMNRVMLGKCDELWIFGSLISKGMKREIKWAKRKKLRICHISNGFRILDAVPSKKAGDAAKYLTECCICGHKAEKTIDAMKYKKGERCDFCPPDYHFAIEGSIAVGHLADGTEFKIDAEDIPVVEANYWYVNGGGYLFRRDSLTREPYRMHRVILGLSQKDDRVVDHINHDKLDNRKCNLRIVTQAENCVKCISSWLSELSSND